MGSRVGAVVRALAFHQCNVISKKTGVDLGTFAKRSTAGAFEVPLGVLIQKKLETLRGEKQFKPHPQNRILVPQRFFLKFLMSALLYRSPPLGKQHLTKNTDHGQNVHPVTDLGEGPWPPP